MPRFTVSVTYGDDRLRLFEVEAPTVNDAEARVLDHALDMLTVSNEIPEDGDEIDDVMSAVPGDRYVHMLDYRVAD